MTFEHEKDGDRRRKPHPPTEADIPNPSRPKEKRPDNPELGLALRTVYQRTVEEEIPPEMLDLLGKLG
ncbi:NepR family anti-sigma factor [Allosphingosinicella sp.]|uniref:NepR family anti-sigma factor n=1 Tax=Allosphingosinicella sp. TaxID=2823234 RepID=UPI002FC16701